MSNRKNQSCFGQQSSLPLFGRYPSDALHTIKNAIADALSRSSMSRDEIVDRLNEIAQRAGVIYGRNGKVSVNILNKWTAGEAEEHQVPLRMLPFLCQAMDDYSPMQALAGCCKGIHIINDEELALLNWAKAEAELRRSRKKARKLAQDAGIE